MNNLHITLNNFTHASRILKETKTLADSKKFDLIYIASFRTEQQDMCVLLQDDIQLNRFELMSKGFGKHFLIQLIKYIEYCVKVYSFYRKQNISVVNIHTLGLLPLGVSLKLLFNAKLIYDTHELETEKNGVIGMRKKISKFLEKYLINYCDVVLVVSESIAKWYQNEYAISKPTVIMNAPMVGDHDLGLNNRQYFRTFFSIRLDQVIFLYQGALSRGRGIELILETFSEMRGDKCVVVFMGYGELGDHIIRYSKESNNIYFHEAVEPNVLLEYTASADFGLSLIESVCLSYDYCMPNKLFEYCIAGLPIIVSNRIEMNSFVTKYQIGVVAEDDTVMALANSIDKVLSLPRIDLKRNLIRAAEENSWEVQSKQMIQAYESV